MSRAKETHIKTKFKTGELLEVNTSEESPPLRPSGRARKGSEKNEKTRRALMLAGERLFGEYGIDATGLRAVCAAAHQKNNNAVQYHFGNKMGLLSAILEFREAQLQPMREEMLKEAEGTGRLNDIRWLLRVCFEPNFRLYRDDHVIEYIKFHAAYITTHRPRGVKHPVDTDSPNCIAYRAAIKHLSARLGFLGRDRLWLRLEAVGEMILNSMIQHSVRREKLTITLDEIFDDSIEMAASAMTAPPTR